MESTFGSALFLVLVLLFSTNVRADTSPPNDPGTTNVPSLSDYKVVERGQHFRVYQRVLSETNFDRVLFRTNSYEEIETGMHSDFRNGQWVEASADIGITDFGAAATNASHQVFFAPNASAAEAVRVITPDGKTLSSHVLCLSYLDTASGSNALIAEVQSSVGQLLPPDQIVYTNAFFGGDCRADIFYVNSKAGLEQNILIHAVALPQEYGLNAESSFLQVWTEFLNFPEPAISTTVVSRDGSPGGAPAGRTDLQFDFGAMTIGPGRAFTLGDNAPLKRSARVSKDWVTISNRTFLVEQIPVSAIAAELAAISSPGSGTNAHHGAMFKPASSEPFLPPVRLARVFDDKVQVAALDPKAGKGILADYSILISQTNFTFTSDSTFLITNFVNLSGVTTIQGGSVTKYKRGAMIAISGAIDSETEEYRNATWTAVDDDTIGSPIAGSTSSPTGTYAYIALDLSAITNGLKYSRFMYCSEAIEYDYSPRPCDLSHVQFINCDYPVVSVASTNNLRNVLIYNAASAVAGADGARFSVEHLTLDRCSSVALDFDLGDSVLTMTNSLLVAVTNWGSTFFSVTTNHIGTNADAVATFQTSGGGSHYLPASSPYRNSGTTNISSGLLGELRTKTVSAPIVLSNTTITAQTILTPQAQLDTDPSPAIGYHFANLDYLFALVRITNVIVNIAPGTTIATAGTYGLALYPGANLFCQGAPTQLNRFVRYNLVQEQVLTNWSGIGASMYGQSWAGTPAAKASFRFTDWSMPASDSYHFWNASQPTAGSFTDCQFHGGSFYYGLPDLYVTNCLFEKVAVAADDGLGIDMALVIRNSLFYGGRFIFGHGTYGTWIFRGNLFDQTYIEQEAFLFPHGTIDQGYNGYANGSDRMYPTNAHDVVSTVTYQTGPLGKYYLPTNSVFNNSGETGANAVRLYHYTTATNQVKETNSIVDLSFHYVALDGSGAAVDSDGGGVPDYIENASGSGTVGAGESDWTPGHSADDYNYLVTPGYLRCEYRENPWGVDARDPSSGVEKPRLYWVVNSNRRAEKQLAYQVLVASSESNLAANNGDMWDSHQVYSDQTIHVEYGATNLQSGQRLWWKVRTWDLYTGMPSQWSTNAFFQMGLLSSSDWNGARWIGVAGYDSSQEYQPCPMYRSLPFTLTNQVARATAYVSAKGVYELWINGRRVLPNILSPEWTDYRKRIQYQTYDVTSYLTNGTSNSTNLIGAIVGEGWFSAPVGVSLEVGRGAYGAAGPQFLLRLRIDNTNGSSFSIVTSNDWSSFTNGPIRRASIYQGESFDATKEGSATNWSTASYPNLDGGGSPYFTTNWTVATNMIASQMVPQPNDPIQIMEMIRPVAMWTNSNFFNQAVTIFDMGQNIAGFCTLSIPSGTAVSGSNMVLRHAETIELNSNNTGDPPQGTSGSIHTNNLRDLENKMALQLDQYTMNGGNAQQFQPRFTYHVFRYVEISGPGAVRAGLTLDSLTGCVVHSSVPFTGDFSCHQTDSNNTNINKLMTNVIWTLRNNLKGVFTSCGGRGERQGYMYDEHIFSQTACFDVDMAAMFTKTTRDIRDNQAPNGRYPVYAPFDNWSAIDPPDGEDPGPEAGGLIFPWRLYQNYGDVRMLAEHYASASNWVFYATNQFPNHIWSNVNKDSESQFNVADWLHSEYLNGHPSGWSPGGIYGGMEGTNWGTAWYAYSADTLAAMSKVLQQDALAKGNNSAANSYSTNFTNYTSLAATVRSAYTNLATSAIPWIHYDTNNNINSVFYNSQSDCLSALVFDMVPQNQRSNVLNILLNGSVGINNFNDHYNNTKPHQSSGYFFSSRGMLELTRDGYTSKAYELMMDTRIESWLYSVVNGFTTTWEGWNTYVSGTGTDRGYYPTSYLRSFNHLAYGAVGEWVWKVVAGINPDDANPGFYNIIVKPEPGGTITNSLASFRSVRGQILCSWTNNLTAKTYVLNITAPANTTASIYLPTTNNLAGITESGSSAAGALGVRSYYLTNWPNWPSGATVFELGSGTYSFVVTNVVLQ